MLIYNLTIGYLRIIKSSKLKVLHLSLKENLTLNKKLKTFLLTIIFLMLGVICWALLLKFIDDVHMNNNGSSLLASLKIKQESRIFNQNFYLNIIKIIVFAPILEEIAYRLPLKLTKRSVILSLITFCAIYVGDNILFLNIRSFGTWYKIFIILLIVLFGSLLIKQSFLDKIKRHYFVYLFYFLAVLFALDHISIYLINLPSNLLVLAPLFVLPQFFLGITSGYLRIKNGIFWSILLHILFNAPTVLNYIYNN